MATDPGPRVVVVNWRDRAHSLAGGAEEYAERVAHALADGGALVTYLTARDAGQRARDTAGRVTTVRRGGRWTVYLWALLWLLRHRRALDVVVDCQNGIPFFSPLVLARRTKVVQVVHHVHQSQFAVHFPPLVARLGCWLEGPAARRVYRRAVTVAVSPSTVLAMRERLGWTGPVYLVPNGMARPVDTGERRDRAPTLVCLGRLVAHKRVDRLIETVAALRSRWPLLRLHVIGGGPMEAALRARAAPLGGAVVVHGYVAEDTKSGLLNRSWLNLSLSDGEGWGLAVVEAAAHGVPTLCRDVDGLRDSVRHGETGWLVPAGADLAEALDLAVTTLADPVAAEPIAAACREWAARFDWAATGLRFRALVADLHAGLPVGARPATAPEALVADFDLPPGARPIEPVWLGSVAGRDGDRHWLLVEQAAATDLTAALSARGATGVAVRPASDAERLLGAAVRSRAGSRS